MIAYDLLNVFQLHDGRTLQKLSFGQTPDGQPVELYVLNNTRGMAAKVITYGAIVTELHVPDRNGRLSDIVLGFDGLMGYLGRHPYFGAALGRVANRMAGGKFTLDDLEYTLTTNDGLNHLHGGLRGFDKVAWQSNPVHANHGMGVKLSYLSRDGEEGYPGNLSVTLTYILTEHNELRIDYTATSDKATPINLSNHSYFNLRGVERCTDILGHELSLDADNFTPHDDALIPTGEIKPVQGTPLDFRKPRAIGARLKELPGEGYDDNFVLNTHSERLALAANVYEPITGRLMEILTTQPCIQFYSGNYLDGSIIGKKGTRYQKYQGFCLETQHFPDSVHHTNFPSNILRPGQTYTQTTVHRFSAK
jgi:aldose 1-epimerase